MSQLRSFSAYDKNANVGLSLVTRTCTLVNLDGSYLTGVAGQYLQIHDKATAPVNNDVPIKSFLLASAGPTNLPSIFQDIGPILLTNGLGIAISSVNEKLTLGVGTYDVFGETEDIERPIASTTVGDLTTPVSVLQVWAEAANIAKTKLIWRITVVSTVNSTTTAYIMLFNKDTPVPSGIPAQFLGPILANTTKILTFGNSGADMTLRREIRSNLVQSPANGLSVGISTDGTIFSEDVSNEFYIKAEYITLA